MPEWKPDQKYWLKKAADGLEAALHLLQPQDRVTLEYLSPAAALRKEADALDYREAKMAELVRLVNELRDEAK
jgi:hypothetical protein